MKEEMKEAGFEEGVDNSNVRYVQNVSLDRGTVGIEDFENEMGEEFVIPFREKVDLESFEIPREIIDVSEELANLIELGHLVVITKEQYEDPDWNSDLLPPVPPWEEDVGVERNILYDVPPTRYDLQLLKNLKKEAQ